MLNFNFLQKGLGIVSGNNFMYDFPKKKKKFFLCSILLTDQIALPDRIDLLRYWTICVLQLFVSQIVTILYIFPWDNTEKIHIILCV